MKRIIVSNGREVSSDSIDNSMNNHIGINWADGGKSWVVRTTEGFIVMGVATTYITNSSVWDSIQDLLKDLNVDGNEFLLFTNYYELKRWLLEDE